MSIDITLKLSLLLDIPQCDSGREGKREERGRKEGRIQGGEVDLKTLLWHRWENTLQPGLVVQENSTVLHEEAGAETAYAANEEAAGDEATQPPPEPVHPQPTAGWPLEALPSHANIKGNHRSSSPQKLVAVELRTDTVRLGKPLLCNHRDLSSIPRHNTVWLGFGFLSLV